MANKDMTFGYHPVATLTCLHKHEVGKPNQNAAQSCSRVKVYVNDDLRADGLRKGWGFRVGTWNVDLLTVKTTIEQPLAKVAQWLCLLLSDSTFMLKNCNSLVFESLSTLYQCDDSIT